jgi:hypothetical protein
LGLEKPYNCAVKLLTLPDPVTVRWSFVSKTTGAVALLICGLYLAAVSFIPFSVFHNPQFAPDWYAIFRPAANALLSGISPYAIDGFFSPPWVAVLMSPFALLPPGVDVAVMSLASYVAWIIAARRLGATPFIIILAILLNPYIIWSTFTGNNDWIVALGLVLPPQIGLFFVLAKPQAGIGIVIFWLFEAWRRNGWREVVRVFAPISIVSLLACIPFGFWPAHLFEATSKYWNLSPFPVLLPVGVIMLYRAIRDRRQGLAIISSPFVSPYVTVLNLPVVMLGLLPSRTETIIAIVSLWLLWFVRGVI